MSGRLRFQPSHASGVIDDGSHINRHHARADHGGTHGEVAAPPSTDPAEVTVTVVDCTTPHLAETYLRADIPVDAAVTTTANQQCGAGFTQYTGLSLDGSPYTINYLIDSEQDRTSNNPLPSTVICLLQGAQGQSLTESARR